MAKKEKIAKSTKPLRIAILSQDARLYSTTRLVEAAEARGHEVRVVNPLLCYMDITSERPNIYYRKESLNHLDAVIPRIGASATFYGTAVVRQFEMIGIYSVNESVAISRARDKLRALQILSRKGIGMPVTGFAHSTKMTHEVIKLVGGAPLVVKLLEGTQGKGVIKAETDIAAESVVEAFRELDEYMLVQQYVKEANGCDLRCFVVGNSVVASMMRKAKVGEFRANLHRGGTATAVKISEEERKTSIAAAKALGLEVAGVDVLRTSKGPLVIEVNSSPGLEGIENATKVDVAGSIIRHIEKNAKPHKTATKGKG